MVDITAPTTNHTWKIYVTDIFDKNTRESENDCNVLQLVFDPQNLGAGKAIGDIDLRIGKIPVATNVRDRDARELFRDDGLVLLPIDLTGPHRQLYVVVFDNLHPEDFLACAKIRHVQPKVVK